MLNKETIRFCIIKGSIGKRNRHDVQEVINDIDGYVDKIYEIIKTWSYIPTVPKKIHIFDKSCGKERDIKVVPYYPDGIIQQLVVYAMKEIFMRGMYHWSCASIPGRGNKRAMDYVKKALRDNPKGTKYAGKFDIHHFYPFVNKEDIIKCLRRKIKDERFLKLIHDIIFSDPEFGLSIGFYLNQWLANYLLEPVDHMICGLDGVKYYVRNMDDIVIMGSNKRKLHMARKIIDEYLHDTYGLRLKDNWQIFKVDSRGIDFVGYRFYHDRTILRRRNFRKLRRNVRTVWKYINTGREIPFRVAAGLLSRAGQFKHCNGWHAYEKYILPISEKRLKNVVRKYARELMKGGVT